MEKERKLKRDSGLPIFPDPVPKNPEELLELMDEASDCARTADGVSAPAFDHSIRVFNQLKAHHDLHMSRETAAAHRGLTQATENLKTATNALKLATLWLAAITALLGGIELWKMVTGH